MSETIKNIIAWIILVAFISLAAVFWMFVGFWGALVVAAMFMLLVLFDSKEDPDHD